METKSKTNEEVSKETKLAREIKADGSKPNEVLEVGHFTRSGRCYTPTTSNKVTTRENKGVESTGELEKTIDEELLCKTKELVTEAQAEEFLKFLKHSE